MVALINSPINAKRKIAIATNAVFDVACGAFVTMKELKLRIAPENSAGTRMLACEYSSSIAHCRFKNSS